MHTRFRLIQDGIPVAWSEGPMQAASRDIHHYAAVYGQDGPVKMQIHIKGKWRPWPPRSKRST